MALIFIAIPPVLVCPEIFDNMTTGGGKMDVRLNDILELKKEHPCGGKQWLVLRVGMDADLIALDFDKPHLLPCHDVASNVVYAARPTDVCLTMCKGAVLYENGQWLTLDIERIKYDVKNIALPCLKK